MLTKISAHCADIFKFRNVNFNQFFIKKYLKNFLK